MRFKDIVEAMNDPVGNPTQIGGKNVNPIKKTDVPVDDVTRAPGDKFGKPEGRLGDEIRQYTSDPDRQKIDRDNAPRPGGRRIGRLPTGQAFPQGTAGASPAEIGPNVGHKASKDTIAGMDKVNQALKDIDVNKLNPEQKKSLYAKLDDILKSAHQLKKYGAPGKALALLGMLGSAGLEYLDPELVNESLLDEVISLNEAQFYIWQIDGNSALASPVGPQGPAPKEQARRINIGQKVLDMSTGTPTLRDKISPVGKDVQLTGQIVDIQGRIT